MGEEFRGTKLFNPCVSDFPKIAMSPGALGKPSSARRSFQLDNSDTVHPLLLKRGPHRQALLQIGRTAVGAHASLREPCDFMRHLLGCHPRLSLRHNLLAEADPQALFGVHLAAGHDDVERPTLANQTWKSYRATIDQWHPPPSTIDDHIRAFCHYAAVGPEGELHAARYRGTLDRRNHGLGQLQPGWSHWSTRDRPAILRKIQRDPHCLSVTCCHAFQVCAGAKGTAFPPEHCYIGRIVSVEGKKGLIERLG